MRSGPSVESLPRNWFAMAAAGFSKSVPLTRSVTSGTKAWVCTSTVLTRRPPIINSRRLPAAAAVAWGGGAASNMLLLRKKMPAEAPATFFKKSLRFGMCSPKTLSGQGFRSQQRSPRVAVFRNGAPLVLAGAALQLSRDILCQKRPELGVGIVHRGIVEVSVSFCLYGNELIG